MSAEKKLIMTRSLLDTEDPCEIILTVYAERPKGDHVIIAPRILT